MHKSFRVTFEEKKVARLIVEVAGICENILKKKKKKKGKKRMNRGSTTSPATIYINKQTFRPCNAFLRRPRKNKT